MPVLDPAAIAGIIADLAVNILSYAGIAALLYAIGGILIRTIGWTFDKILINFIGFFYKYFETIINGTLLTDSVVEGMMNRVYLLVGVFVAFRLGMLLINYIINPSEVMDEKVGVNALIKRVIIGMILIIFMPNIFSLAFRIQEAILADQVIERVIMPENDIAKVTAYKEKHGMGKIIGMTIFRGFFSLAPSAEKKQSVANNFDKATNIDKDYDLSVIDSLGGGGLDGGILYKVGDDYAHDYFPIFSTVVLCFVLYMLVQYCLDAVVRSFKLSVLQVIAPICIVEYMINSDRNEVFKSWRKAVIATFTMLFMRVASIWFVAYVTMLMQPGMVESTSLLQTSDNLLKAVIILGLLAFMMDFPKMMSDVFGLDLDQSGSVKGVLGKAIGGATAGLAIGGAVAGLGMKAAGGLAKTGKGAVSSLAQGRANRLSGLAASNPSNARLAKAAARASSFAAGVTNPGKTALRQGAAGLAAGVSAVGALAKSGNGLGFKANYQTTRAGVNNMVSKVANHKAGQGALQLGNAVVSSAKASHLGSVLKAGAVATGTAILASNSVTKSASGGYQQTTGAVDQKVKGIEQKNEEQIYREHTVQVMDQINATSTASYGMQVASGAKLDAIVDNTEATATQTVNIDQKLGTISGDVKAVAQNTETTAQQTVNIDQKLGTISGDVKAVAQNTATTAEQIVNVDQKLGTISGDIKTVADNTEVTAEQLINVDQKLGTISGDIKTVADNTEVTAEQLINVDQKLGTISGDVKAVAQNTETTAQQIVNVDQKLGTISGDVKAVAENTETTAQHTVNIERKLIDADGNGPTSGK